MDGNNIIELALVGAATLVSYVGIKHYVNYKNQALLSSERIDIEKIHVYRKNRASRRKNKKRSRRN